MTTAFSKGQKVRARWFEKEWDDMEVVRVISHMWMVVKDEYGNTQTVQTLNWRVRMVAPTLA